MPLSLDQYVSVHATALDVRARRGELIANNLANADTPGYQARAHVECGGMHAHILVQAQGHRLLLVSALRQGG